MLIIMWLILFITNLTLLKKNCYSKCKWTINIGDPELSNQTKRRAFSMTTQWHYLTDSEFVSEKDGQRKIGHDMLRACGRSPCDRGINGYRVKNSTAANDSAVGRKGGEKERERRGKERKRSEQRWAKFLIYKWNGSGYRTKPRCAPNVLVNEFYRRNGCANNVAIACHCGK